MRVGIMGPLLAMLAAVKTPDAARNDAPLLGYAPEAPRLVWGGSFWRHVRRPSQRKRRLMARRVA